MKTSGIVVMALVAALAAVAGENAMETPLFDTPPDLVEGIPDEFPRFYFGGHDESAQLLGRYLWHHFSTRLGRGKTMFNQEYLATSDAWMGGALRPGWGGPIQQLARHDLLAVEIDPEGYVHTHQHFSHAHEQGWPFPMWVQNPTGPEGYGAGWHFQDDGPGWAWDALRHYPDSQFARARSIEGWTLENVRSLGIVEGKWRLEADGASPSIVTPDNARIVTFCAPFLQLRWTRTGEPPEGRLPYVEWMREEDSGFSPERRVYFGFDSGNPDYEGVSGTTHSMIAMYRHPQWTGNVRRIRIALAPGESDVAFRLDSFFTVYDTRHTINNPIYILACWEYFRWTGDLDFLRRTINTMRMALRYQQTELGGLRLNRIRNEWVGHTGISGLEIHPDGTKTIHYGQGIGSNYWDLLPFGWDDLYATAQYHAATLAMAEIEEAVLRHPGWDLPRGGPAFDPDFLRRHAAAVKEEANRLFWNEDTGRFFAAIDKEGAAHDYGFTFLNLDAIWYGIASDEHARAILDWLEGARIVAGDTSQGDDIYHWRFGPRATTRRNIEWYGFMWTGPESIPWGGQVQDGGAVLGFTFYDLWARLQVRGPDNAWARLRAILDWEKEVWAEGGYRAYYADGKRGTTLQGGGTAGGLGIDFEFFESSLLPSIVVHGFLGMRPGADGLAIAPRLPADCPRMGIRNVLCRGALLDVAAAEGVIEIDVKRAPLEPLRLLLGEGWRQTGGADAPDFMIHAAGRYRFERE